MDSFWVAILLAYVHYKIFAYLWDLSTDMVATVKDIFVDSAILWKRVSWSGTAVLVTADMLL